MRPPAALQGMQGTLQETHALDHNLQQPTNQQAEAITNPLEKQHEIS